MILVSFGKDSTFHKAEFLRISDHIIQISGDFEQITSGLQTYTLDRIHLGDFSEYATVYREIDGGYQLSNDGTVYIEPIILPPTMEELAAQARAKRKSLLEETDKFFLLDAPVSKECLAELRVYRQALRDITEQTGFPEAIEWPQLPAIIKAAPDPVDAAFDALMGGDDHA